MTDAENAEILSETIATVATEPAKVSGDAGSAEQHKLTDLIAADKYVRAKAASRSPRVGLRFVKLIPPGAA